jgi:hypothetical protein
MNDVGETTYLKTTIKDLLDDCSDIELLYLISALLREEKESG